MAESKKHKGWKIGFIAALSVVILAGGVGIGTAPSSAAHQFDSEANSPMRTTPGLAQPVAPPVKITALPADGALQVNPGVAPALTVVDGRIAHVTLTPSAGGDAVSGQISVDGASWAAGAPLAFNTSYRYTYTVTDAVGRETTKTQTFTTVPTANEADAAVYPLDGMKVGVAQPVQITFSEPVVNKLAVENAIKITTTSGQIGAFHWYNDKMVRFRPETFWGANSTITVDLQLFGVDFGNGQIGNFNKKVTVNIGNKVTAVADSAAKTFTVSINDQPAGSWPVTMGDTRFPSAKGYLVLMEKHRYDHFVAASIGLKPGDPANYGELDVEYATRLTPSGEYIHQALDSALPYIGNTNVSHGCIGMTADRAAWVFNNMTTGDVVQVINTQGDYADFTDGYGDWNIPWAQYASR